MTAVGEPWNHNIHYHALVLRSLPASSERGLDVGCGQGILTRELRQRVRHMVGIDLDEPSIAQARQDADDAGTEFVLGDFLTHPFAASSFDVIVSIAALHHMDSSTALARMANLLRPGGRLLVIGLARSRPIDIPLDLAGLVADRVYKRSRTYWDHAAPTVWPPPLTCGQARHVARESLPGARYRRHVLWRYSVRWTKPSA